MLKYCWIDLIWLETFIFCRVVSKIVKNVFKIFVYEQIFIFDRREKKHLIKNLEDVQWENVAKEILMNDETPLVFSSKKIVLKRNKFEWSSFERGGMTL